LLFIVFLLSGMVIADIQHDALHHVLARLSHALFWISTMSTHVLDHIVHLTPPGTVEEAAAEFQSGFRCILVL